MAARGDGPIRLPKRIRMLPGLEPGQTRTETEAIADLTELAAGLSPDGIWVLVATLEHVARRWMSDYMESGEQSVGTSVQVERVLPAPHATSITSKATLREVRGRRYVFAVELRNEAGELLGSGTNERAVISTTPNG